MEKQSDTHIIEKKIIAILSQPVIHLDEWFELLKLFHQNINIIRNGTNIKHIQACQQVVLRLKTQYNQISSPLLLRVDLSNWSTILQEVIYQSDLLYTLGRQCSREVLFFIQLFSQRVSLNPILIQPTQDSLFEMIKSLVFYTYLLPQEPYFKGWKQLENTLHSKLPINTVNLIYAYLFLPKNLHTKYQNSLLQNTFSSSMKQIENPKQFDLINVGLFINVKLQNDPDHEDLLTYLFIHNAYSLIEVFTTIIPLPWEKIANIMNTMTLEEQINLIDTLQAYAINKQQFIALLRLQNIKPHCKSQASMANESYLIDTCKIIHEKNIYLMAKRQQQIQYICHHPIGLASLEKLLIHFKKTITNPQAWLDQIYIDQYSIANQNITETKRTLFNMTKKNHVSRQLFDKIFDPSSNNYHDLNKLKTSYIKTVQSMLYNFKQPTLLHGLKGLFDDHADTARNELINALDQAVKAFEWETDFTKVISYMRHIIEQNHEHLCAKGRTLFNEISDLDLTCLKHPMLGY